MRLRRAVLVLISECVVALTSAAQRPIHFTTSEGTWISLDIAPDGRTIVFELLGDIYSMPIAGGAARVILTGRAFQSQPRYAPDGAHLAYVSDGSGTDNLWVSDADGSAPRQLSRVPRATVLSPAWAADGTSIYATVVEGPSAELWQFDVATGAGARIIANSNGPPSPLVSSPAPGPYSAHVAADGSALWFTSVTPRPYGSRSGASSSVVRRNLTTGRDEPVVLEEPVAMSPVTSPDGRWLVYGAQSRGRTGFRLRDLSSATERWLQYPTQRNGLEARASRDVLPGYAFTPDGRALVAAYGGQIHRIDIGTGRDTVIPFSARYVADLPAPLVAARRIGPDVRGRLVQQPALAADGRIAFSVLARVYVAPAGGGAPRRLTAATMPREFMPAWSPDGRWIAYVTWGPEGGHLFKAPATGGTPIRLSDDAAFWADPVWAPDGSALFALRAPVGSARTQPLAVPLDVTIVRIGAAGGAPVALMPGRGLRHPHFSGDATRLWFSSPAGLESMALTGQDRRVHFRQPAPSLAGGAPVPMEIRASPDGHRVAFLAGERLSVLDLPSTSAADAPPVLDPTRGKELSRDAPTAFAWSPAGDNIGWVTGTTLHERALSSGSAERRFPLAVTLPRDVPHGSVVLRGAHAITMRGAEIIQDADIVVTGDRIAAVGPTGAVAVPPGARVIDVHGATVMPGIVDIHAHWQLRRELLEPEAPSTFANLAFGVTTIRDPQTSPEIFAYADLADIGTTPSPRIFSTGPGLFAETDFQSLDDARRTLRRYRDDYGTHLLKSYLVGSRQQRQWVVQASRELGMLPTTEGGADSKMDITHALDAFSGNEHALPTAPLYDDVVQLFARSGITYTPTLLVSFGAALPIFRLLAAERPADDPRLQRFFPQDELYQRTATRLLAFPDEDYNDRETSAGAAAILRNGGHVALGGHGEMQGLQVHWEMRLLAEGGMPAHDVLRVATINGATAIGLGEDLGSLEVGKLADLIVLDRDPLVDIRNTTSIRQVMKNGVLYDGETLDQIAPSPTPLPPPWWRAGSRGAGGALDEHAVDVVARREMDRQRIPGLAIAVIRGDRVLLAKGYGLASLEQHVPVGPETMFESGSLGKMFTSAGVLSLVEIGTLSLDASVRRYLPDAPATWEPITIRHLLSHTSGIPDYTSDAMDYHRDYTESQLTAMAYALPLEFAPGTRWNYSNTGYVLLGVIIGKVTGRPYWEYLREKIFTPASMPTIRIIDDAEIVPQRASGYQLDGGAFRNQEWVSRTLNTTADGSLLLSLRDLIAWNAAIRERRVLSESSWKQLFTPIRLNSGRSHPYGFGWFLDSLNGQRVLQHGGSWQGFRTQFTRFEGSDLTVIVLANSNTTNPAVIAERVAAVADAQLSPPPLPTTPITDRDPAVTAYVRVLLAKSARGELRAADFEFVRATVVPRMSAAYARSLGTLGALTRLELLESGVVADDRSFTYRATYGAARILVHARIGPGGRLTGWQLSPEE